MKLISAVLKICAVFIGVSLVIGSITGFPFKIFKIYSFNARMAIRLILFIFGIFYILPNELLLNRRYLMIPFTILFMTGAFIFTYFVFFEITQYNSGGIDIVGQFIIIMSAPLSLILEWKSERIEENLHNNK